MSLVLSPPEWRKVVDPHTGAVLTQWTAWPAIHHHCYFTNPTVTHDSRRGLFISWRTGHPNLFSICFETGELARITHRQDINPFSVAPSSTREWVYFSARQSVWAVSGRTGEQRELARFPGSRLGNCSLNAKGTLLAISVRRDSLCELAIIEIDTGRLTIATRAQEIGHIQFSPRDDSLLLYSGSPTQRLWLHDRTTGRDRLVYPQREDQWIVHESWRRGEADEIIFPHWPDALCAIRPDGSGLRTVATINAWHACSSPDGKWIVCDTNHPDRGLLLINAVSGSHRVLCQAMATQRGSQWRYRLPAAGAGIDLSILRSDTPEDDQPPTPQEPQGIYGPQWTHPHPSFTPDGRQVIFTSDREGWSHVYSVEVPAASDLH